MDACRKVNDGCELLLSERMLRRVTCVIAAALLYMNPWIDAASSNVETHLLSQVQRPSFVDSLGANLFGDSVDLYSGAVTFSHVDVELKGNQGQAISVVRTLRSSDQRMGHKLGGSHFADWELDIPRLTGVFAWSGSSNQSGWQVSTPGYPHKRCSVDKSNFMLGTPPVAQGLTNGAPDPIGKFSSAEYWYGNMLHLPGGESASMMVLDPANQNVATDQEYYWATKTGWIFACLPQTANGKLGEAFLAVSPDGTRYKFDWIVDVGFEPIQKAIDRCTVPGPSCTSTLSRVKTFIYPTLVTDRYGNTTSYVYDSDKPFRILSIIASDGRSLSFNYESSSSPRISSVSSGGRIWRYNYVNVDNVGVQLAEVTLPDLTRWSFSPAHINPGGHGRQDCTSPPGYSEGTTSLFQMVHPSGAIGEFEFRTTRQTRSYVPRACIMTAGGSGYPGYSPVIDIAALVRKSISGVGIEPLVWNISYSNPLFSFVTSCSSQPCQSTKATTVTNAVGAWSRTTFSNKFNDLEGSPVLIEKGVGENILSVETFSYISHDSSQLFPKKIGNLPCYRCDDLSEHYYPMKSRSLSLSGREFKTINQRFDRFSRPVEITKESR